MTVNVAKGVRGFSLLEVLVATCILSSALAGLAGLLVLAGASDRQSRAVTVGTLLATGKLNQLQGEVRLGARDPGSGTEVVDSNGLPIVDLHRSSGAPAFVRQWSSDRLPLDSSLLLLSVVVAPWPGRVPDDVDRAAGAVRLSSVVRGTE